MLDEVAKLSTKIESNNFDCIDLIKYIFNLNDTDIRVLKSFSGDKGNTIAGISKKLKKDRSTIHRSLEKLISCRICYKERKSGKIRGFVDYYYRIPLKEIYKKSEKKLDQCYTKIKKMLSELDENWI